MVNSLKRPESRMAFGSNLVKPSELFGSVKKTINRNKQSRCQCKHHQQKLLAKQEEQRIQLQEQLSARGDRRKVFSTNVNGANLSNVNSNFGGHSNNQAFHPGPPPPFHIRLRKSIYLFSKFFIKL